MPQRSRSEPDVAEIVALAHVLDRDQQRPATELAAREKRLAVGLPAHRGDPVAVGLAWLEAVEAEDESARTVHQRARAAMQVTSVLIAIAAILLGWSATLGAFYFDGSGRVNAVLVLALLVALPAAFLVPFLFAALPTEMAARVPGVGVIAVLARALNPGRLALLVWRFFPRDLRESIALLTGRAGKHQRLHGDLQKWAILRWSQLFALSFQAAALTACLALVVFTDLAFGWSTTLTTGEASRDAQRVHRITSAMAAPWSWAVDDAQPSLALIEESRYFRAAAGPITPAQAARLGGWWRFVVLAIAVYGLLPRVLTLLFARARLRAAARAAVLAGPGLSAVLRRIHRARIETAAPEPEIGEQRLAGVQTPAEELARDAAPVSAIVNWSGVPAKADALDQAFPGAKVFEAGGATTVAEDEALAGRIRVALDESPGEVLVLVKGWEPPLMEFLDFVRALRAGLARPAAAIVVFPLGLGEGGEELPTASAGQLKLWRDKLATLGDPWLRVAANREEVLK